MDSAILRVRIRDAEKVKPATTLFDLKPGTPLPTDADLKAEDSALWDRRLLAQITEESDALCARMKFLAPQSRLEAARHLAKGINSTSEMFNCAIFLREHPEDSTRELFEEPKEPTTEELF